MRLSLDDDGNFMDAGCAGGGYVLLVSGVFTGALCQAEAGGAG